jgi:ElaB/YqjD/DUF883 family membrane-anchored ribosome-binding protein
MFTHKSPKNSHILADSVAPLIDDASEQANELAQRVVEVIRESTQQLQAKASNASALTRAYIRDEPVKSLLIAAATGAGLMALLSFSLRSRHRD